MVIDIYIILLKSRGLLAPHFTFLETVVSKKHVLLYRSSEARHGRGQGDLVMLHCVHQPHPWRCSHSLCFVLSSHGESRTVEQSKGKNPTRTSEHLHSRLSFLPLKDPSLGEESALQYLENTTNNYGLRRWENISFYVHGV